MKLQLLHYQDI